MVEEMSGSGTNSVESNVYIEEESSRGKDSGYLCHQGPTC